MSKLIRVNINLDNSHSLTDFPVDIYSGTTTGNATNLVYAGVTTSPVTFTVDDSIIEFGLKLVSTGCLDQVLLIKSPSVDCEICADFVEFFNPAPTPQTTQTVLESCINSLTFVVEYNNSGLNGSPCSGGHGCNRAKFDIMANNVNIGQVNMNNAGGIYDDVNRPPTYPNYPGASSGDRYNALSITSQQAQSIAANSPNGFIDFSFDCACIWSGANQNCVGSSCHTDVSWVRIIKDMGLSTEEELYNGCPNGNFIEDFDPCPPQPTPSETPLSTPNATPNVTPNPTPTATPDATPLPTNGSTPNPTSTPNSTPVSTPTPTPACLCYRTIPYDGTMFVVYKDCDGNQVTINETCYSPNCQGIDFSATEIVSGQSDVFTIDCNEPTSTPNATPDATPNATPIPTSNATPQPTPDATPVATPNATPQPTPEATPQPTPEANPPTNQNIIIKGFVSGSEGSSFPVYDGQGPIGEYNIPQGSGKVHSIYNGSDETIYVRMMAKTYSGSNQSFDAMAKIVYSNVTQDGDQIYVGIQGGTQNANYQSTISSGNPAYGGSQWVIEIPPIGTRTVAVGIHPSYYSTDGENVSYTFAWSLNESFVRAEQNEITTYVA